MDDIKKLSFRLIGYPLGHSMSPYFHQKLFALSDINAEFDYFEIEPDKFDEKSAKLRGLDGFNITIPYKQRIIPLLDQIDPRAKRCGAVNTVKSEGGRLLGYNTDAIGFLRALEDADIGLCGRVLLCGAGGASRMMACEALERGCALVIATRDGKNAQAAKTDLLKVFPDADISAQKLDELSGRFDLILNGTPAGMYPKTEGCPVSLTVINNAAAVFDAIYNPCETTFVKAARAAGAKAAGGIDMFVWQAVAAEEIWMDAHFAKSDIEALKAEMIEYIGSHFNAGGGTK